MRACGRMVQVLTQGVPERLVDRFVPARTLLFNSPLMTVTLVESTSRQQHLSGLYKTVGEAISLALDRGIERLH